MVAWHCIWVDWASNHGQLYTPDDLLPYLISSWISKTIYSNVVIILS